jgi:hypothetical protein
MTGVQESLAEIAEDSYDSYVAAAATERGIRRQLKSGKLTPHQRRILSSQLQTVSQDVIQLRNAAKAAAKEAEKRGSGPVGYSAFIRRGGGLTRRAIQKLNRQTKRRA